MLRVSTGRQLGNALKSTGPKTVEGKEASRRNSLKHGLTGAGVVIPGEDAEELAWQAAAFRAELAPDGTPTARLLAERVATLAVRLRRSARPKYAATDERARLAAFDFDEFRAVEAGRLLDAIDEGTNRDDPLAMPEGVDLIDATLGELRAAALTAAGDPAAWLGDDAARLARCLPGGARDLGSPRQVVERIDAERARLGSTRSKFDRAAIARAQAIHLVLVDDPPKTLRARRYEAACSRGLYQALREIRQVRKPAPATVEPPTPPTAAETALAVEELRLHLARVGSAPAATATPPVGLFFPGAAASIPGPARRARRLDRGGFPGKLAGVPDRSRPNPFGEESMRLNPPAICLLAVALAATALGDEPKSAPLPLAQRGDSIVACGQKISIGAPVILWTDPGGFDASKLPEKDADGKPATLGYGARERGVDPAAVAEAKKNGWTLPILQKAVDQFVIHYDVCGTSKKCFEVLQARDLAVQFMLDLDGTIYQTCDLKEAAYHATKANGRSIGIEIANMGAYSAAEMAKGPLSKWYGKDESGKTVITLPKGATVPTLAAGAPPLRPSRDEPVVGTVQGQELTQYDLTPQQYAALAKLTAGLCKTFPKIKHDVPRDEQGKVINHVLADDAYKGYQGILGHYHVQLNKTDPGPAFRWDLILGESHSPAK